MDLPDVRPDGFCAECGEKPAITTDGRFCRPCLKSLVRHLSPGPTRRYRAAPGLTARSSGTHLIDRAERAADRDYWMMTAQGSQENAVRAMEGD